MFGSLRGSEDFHREVVVEVQYLTKLHGDDALRIAREKADRPDLRTQRRKVLEAAVRKLAGQPEKRSLLGRWFD
ncbi:MAG: hypothetical protein V4466_18080 [Pseudomonadota bacterium]